MVEAIINTVKELPAEKGGNDQNELEIKGAINNEHNEAENEENVKEVNEAKWKRNAVGI